VGSDGRLCIDHHPVRVGSHIPIPIPNPIRNCRRICICICIRVHSHIHIRRVAERWRRSRCLVELIEGHVRDLGWWHVGMLCYDMISDVMTYLVATNKTLNRLFLMTQSFVC